MCESLEPGRVVGALRSLIGDRNLYARLATNGRRAFDRHLTLATMRTRFARFLGVEEDSLRTEAEIAEQVDAVTRLEDELAERDKTIVWLHREVATRDEEIRRLHAVAAEQHDTINWLHREVAQRDETIARLEAERGGSR